MNSPVDSVMLMQVKLSFTAVKSKTAIEQLFRRFVDIVQTFVARKSESNFADSIKEAARQQHISCVDKLY